MPISTVLLYKLPRNDLQLPFFNYSDSGKPLSILGFPAHCKLLYITSTRPFWTFCTRAPSGFKYEWNVSFWIWINHPSGRFIHIQNETMCEHSRVLNTLMQCMCHSYSKPEGALHEESTFLFKIICFFVHVHTHPKHAQRKSDFK